MDRNGYRLFVGNDPALKPLLEELNTSTVSNIRRGQIGEEITKSVFGDLEGYTILSRKLNGSDNGFDFVIFKGSLENPSEILIVEAKPLSANGTIKLGSTVSKGPQMSDTWVNGTIQEMISSGDRDLEELGFALLSRNDYLQKYVCAIDKSTNEAVILRLGDY